MPRRGIRLHTPRARSVSRFEPRNIRKLKTSLPWNSHSVYILMGVGICVPPSVRILNHVA